MSDSIKVAIKVRPLIKREKDDNLPIQWVVHGNSIVSIDTELKKRGDDGFCFDHIFDINSSNSDVFDSIVKPIVDAAVNGFNGTVFAYGQTSSGKTHTMVGTLNEPGIIPLAVDHMFDAITNSGGREFLLRVSYLEIYKEKVNDLLNRTGTDLKLKEDSSGQVILQCKEEITNCPENMLSIMKKGEKYRRTGETNMNELSSRSHTIFRITIESREARGDSDSAIQVSQLNLVDLAGSERARQTGATGERFKEGLHINLSLSTLGLVIKQLSECQDGQKYVNFRDSKLTRLLQNSLGGNAMTAIICAVTPAAVEETQCTLSFACRAKSVKNKPHINEVMSDAALLKRYAKQISKLQTELEKIKTENRVAEVEEMESKLQEKERINQMLEERIGLLKTRIVSGDVTGDDSFKCKSKRRQTWGGPGMFKHMEVFQPTPGLPTIKEVSREKSCRKSIIQSDHIDLMNQTFQTAFTDFELELFKSECDREDEENGSDSDDEPFITRRVTFRDDVYTIKSKDSIIPEAISISSEIRNSATQTVSCQVSPSTPKQVLRRRINYLTNEFTELREFTTLEKQLLGDSDGPKKYAPEVKKLLGSLNLAEETNVNRVIGELCKKLGKLEQENILEKEASRKAMIRVSELEMKMKNIISERDEFQYMSGELRVELKKRTAELELKNMSEESVKEEELKKILELERKLKDVTLQNAELRAESTKKITELQKEVENVVSERKEFELIRRELCMQLNKKSLELEKMKNDPETSNQEVSTNLRELEKKYEDILFEKATLEQAVVDLQTELDRVSSDAESRLVLERTAQAEILGNVSQLQKQVEDLVSKRNELQRVNVDLKAQLIHNVADFESQIAVEQVPKEEAVKKSPKFEEQETIDKLSVLERKVESITSEKNELKEKMQLEQAEYQKMMEKVNNLTNQIEDIANQNGEFERVNAELRQNISNLETKAVEQVEVISELKSKVGSLAFEKEELHCIIAEKDEECSKLKSIAKQKINATETINLEKKQLELKENDNLVYDDGNVTMTESIMNNTDNQSFLSYSRQFNDSAFNTSALILSIEMEKSQLEETLYLKSRELDDIKCDVHSLKQDIESLQKTIYLLTTENMEMVNKLTVEHENAKQAEMNLQGTIDELYVRITEVTNQKITLESNLTALNDQLESMRIRDVSSKVVSNEDDAFALYKTKIDKLTAENIELSTSIAEKNREVENIKESKSLLFDHECMYKEKTAALMERNECLQTENGELSTDLMDKIEEIDELKEKCEILKKKMEQSLKCVKTSIDDTMDDIQSENSVLKAEIIELKIKLTKLSEENTKFSNDLLQTIEELDSSRNEKMLEDSAESTYKEHIQKDDHHEALTLANKVATLQEKVNKLTLLNKKLSDLKLTSCNQCTYLKNLNEDRRALKLESKSLNQRFEDLQKKFVRKCEDTEILKNRIDQKLNISGRELSPKVSYVDDIDVSLVEERVQTLNDELQALKTDHGKLTGLYEDSCNKFEQLRSELSIDEESASNFTPKKRSEKNICRVVQIQSHIDQLKIDINEMRKNSTHFAATLNQVRGEKTNLLNEIDGLRTSNEELKQKLSTYEVIAKENIQVLESELTNMSKEMEQFFARERMLENQRLTLEMELEELKIGWDNKCALIESLKNELQLANSKDNKYNEELKLLKKQREELEQRAMSDILELQEHIARQNNLCEELQEKGVHMEQLYHQSEQEKLALMEKLRTVEVELHNIPNNLEARYTNEFDSMFMQYQHRVKESENNLRLLNGTLNKYIDENLKLKQELNKLKSIEESTSCKEKALIGDVEKLNKELSDIRLCMMKELRSLKCSINSAEISKQSANEVFLILVETLVLKEQEMIKTMRETYEGQKRQLEDKIKQSADSEKRATIWTKELEGEIEKLQTELTEQEHNQKGYENKITQLDHLLREYSHENEVLRENAKTLEVDLHNLQTEYEKLYNIDSKQEEAIFDAQKREKEVQEVLKRKELEFQSKFQAENEMYEKKINELSRSLDCYKLKNLEMSSVVEEFKVNEKKLMNIIEANTAQIKKSDQNIKTMKAEFEQLTGAYNEASQQLDQKSVHIEDISAILKSKCDSLTEYRTKLEAILPEYEKLKDHVSDQKAIIERCRQEIEEFKAERVQQLETIKEKLKAEEIKNAELSNQLNSRNVAMTKELRKKYEELQQENAKLEQKVRCSTSNIRAEVEIEELKEMNKRLQSNLEGASNRVAELQEVRDQTLTQLIDIKTMYDMLLQENTKIKTTLSSYEIKFNASNTSTQESKLDELLLEKNSIALELEYKKLQLAQQEKEANEYVSQLQQLRDKNKELDEELEEYAVIIQERSVEISELESKLYSRFTENTRIVELEEKMNSLNEENRKLRDQVDAMKMRLQMDMEDTSSDDDIKTQQNKNVIRILKRENPDLQSKLKALTNSRRQYDNLFKENLKMKNILQLYKSKLDQPHSESRVDEKLGDSNHDEIKIACELESRISELNHKECANQIRDLASKNKDLDIELGTCASIIHERDIEILKLKEIAKIMTEENNKLRSEIGELQKRSRSNNSINNCIEEFDYRLWNKTSMSNESVKKQLQNSVVKENDKSKELKKKIHDLELQLVSKNGQLAALEIQIQSESFPYQRKCKELEEQLLAFRNKNTELNLEIQKLRKVVNDVNTWECDVCRRWRVNRKDQGCQTIPVKTVRFCSTNSGVVDEYVRIEKIEKEKTMLKELCRSRNRHIKELEMEIDRMKELMKT